MPLVPPSLAANATAPLSEQIRAKSESKHNDGDDFQDEWEATDADVASFSSDAHYTIAARVMKFMQTGDLDDGVMMLSQKLENEKNQGTLQNYSGKKIRKAWSMN